MVLTFSPLLKYSHIGIADPQQNATNVVKINNFPNIMSFVFF